MAPNESTVQLHQFYLCLFLKVIELVINKNRKEKLEELLEKIGVSFTFFEVQQEDG